MPTITALANGDDDTEVTEQRRLQRRVKELAGERRTQVAARQRAVAAPMPDAAPVISAVRPVKSYPSVMARGLARYAALSMPRVKCAPARKTGAHPNYASSFSLM